MTMDRDSEHPSASAAPGEGHYPDDEVDLLYVLGVLWRGKWITIATTALFGGFAFFYALGSLLLPPEESYMPDVYEPTALLLVNEESGVSGLQAALGDSGLARAAGLRTGGITSYGQLSVKLLGSRSVLDPIVEEFDLIDRWEIEESPVANSRSALRDRSRFTHEPETGTVTIGFEYRDPELAHRIVNRYVELIEEQFSRIGGGRALARKALLEGQLEDVEREIAALEGELEAFQAEHGVPSVSAFARQQTEFLAEVRSELLMKELELQTYGEFTGGDDPQMRRLRAERDNLRQLADEIEGGWRMFPGIGPSQQELPALQRRFARIERELSVQARIYETLRQQYELARLNAEGEEPVMQVYELADIPDRKSGPARSIMVIVATAAGFFIGIFLTFLAHFAHNVRRDPEAIRRFRGER